jgi:hypothetical protein
VALERFDGTIDGLRGTVVLQQYGSMNDSVTLYYEFVPGSGTDGLTVSPERSTSPSPKETTVSTSTTP